MRDITASHYCYFGRLFLVICMGCLLLACSVDPSDYAQQSPTLDFRKYMQGELTGWGIFQERSGKVSKRFHINMTADWQGDEGKFTENFSFDDGTKQRRDWILTRIDDHHYRGSANDSVGIGQGEVWGNTMHWEYTILTETDSGTYALDYDYWMYLIDENTLINRASLTKFGVTIGDITVTFHKK